MPGIHVCFGRVWLGPALARFQERHPRTEIELQLTEQLPDPAVERFDGAIWLWAAKSRQTVQWVSGRLARNQRVLVTSPAYLGKHGAVKNFDALQEHACLIVRENGGDKDITGGPAFDRWQLQRDRDKSPAQVRVHEPLVGNSGELVRDWRLDGWGIMLRSLWDIAPQLAHGDLVRVLPGYFMPDADIHWLAPYRPDAPRRIRLLIDFLAAHFSEKPWKKTGRPDQPTATTPKSPLQAERRGSHPKP